MNNHQRIKNINWNSYRKELSKYVDIKIKFIQKFLEKNFNIKENKKFYYKIFFLPLSKYYFNKKFPGNKLKTQERERDKFSKYLNILDYLKIEDFTENKTKFTKNVSINFFHRHSNFKKFNSKLISEISSKNLNKKISLKSLLINIRLRYSSDFKKNEILFLKRRIILLILNYNFLKKNSTKVKNILINTHGMMSNADQVMLGCLSQNAKIITMVCGLQHFMYKYHDQDDYVMKISNKILSWGKNIKTNSKFSIFGSFYSNMNKLRNKNKSIIILPSVPTKNIRNPVSSYASLNRYEFSNFIIKKIVNEIKKISSKDKFCNLQCKMSDFEYYKNSFKKYNIKNNLIYSDINNENFGRSYLKTYVLYFSTAIIENFYAKSNVKICINSAWVDLRKKFQTNLNKINNKKFLKSNEQFILDSCKIITPKKAKKKLQKILK